MWGTISQNEMIGRFVWSLIASNLDCFAGLRQSVGVSLSRCREIGSGTNPTGRFRFPRGPRRLVFPFSGISLRSGAGFWTDPSTTRPKERTRHGRRQAPDLARPNSQASTSLEGVCQPGFASGRARRGLALAAGHSAGPWLAARPGQRPACSRLGRAGGVESVVDRPDRAGGRRPPRPKGEARPGGPPGRARPGGPRSAGLPAGLRDGHDRGSDGRRRAPGRRDDRRPRRPRLGPESRSGSGSGSGSGSRRRTWIGPRSGPVTDRRHRPPQRGDLADRQPRAGRAGHGRDPRRLVDDCPQSADRAGRHAGRRGPIAGDPRQGRPGPRPGRGGRPDLDRRRQELANPRPPGGPRRPGPVRRDSGSPAGGRPLDLQRGRRTPRRRGDRLGLARRPPGARPDRRGLRRPPGSDRLDHCQARRDQPRRLGHGRGDRSRVRGHARPAPGPGQPRRPGQDAAQRHEAPRRPGDRPGGGQPPGRPDHPGRRRAGRSDREPRRLRRPRRRPAGHAPRAGSRRWHGEPHQGKGRGRSPGSQVGRGQPDGQGRPRLGRVALRNGRPRRPLGAAPRRPRPRAPSTSPATPGWPAIIGGTATRSRAGSRPTARD